MGFRGTDRAYDLFMGRYSAALAPLFADFAGIEAPSRALDVGCGPGALTGELVRRLGAGSVSAVDPTEQFVAACRERHPGVTVEQGIAEAVPFPDDTFDAALAQLVVVFMRDAVAGVRELARVTRAGGVVAVCMWAEGADMELLELVQGAGRVVAPDHPTRTAVERYRTENELLELFRDAGIEEIEAGSLDVAAAYASFDELWDSVAVGVGPIGELLEALDEEQTHRLRDEIRGRLGDRGEPFSLSGRAFAIRGRPPS